MHLFLLEIDWLVLQDFVNGTWYAKFHAFVSLLMQKKQEWDILGIQKLRKTVKMEAFYIQNE